MRTSVEITREAAASLNVSFSRALLAIFIMCGYSVMNLMHFTSEYADAGFPTRTSPFHFSFAPNNSTKIDFMHIPKTGGISLIADMKALHIFDPPDDWKDDESSFLDSRIRNSQYLFTTFREPGSHLVSMWKYCRSEESHRGNTKFADQMRKVPFDSWVHYWAYFANHFTERFQCNETFEEFNYKHYDIAASTSRTRQPHEPFGCFYIPVNLQTTRLGVFDESRMRATVRGMFHVGVQDMYRETLCVLAFKIYRHTVEKCGCQSGNDEFSHNNVTPLKVEKGMAEMNTFDVLNTAETQDIVRLTYLDRVVYETARNRLEWEIQYIQSKEDPGFLCPQSN